MPDAPQPVPIAFCITDLDPGGAERALVQIVTRLDRDRWQPAVFCLSQPGELVAALEAAGIPVTCFGARGLRSLFVVFRLARQLRKLRPALLQTFLYHANIVGRIAAWLARVPRVVSGIRVAERRSRLRLWIDRWTQWMVDKHVCVSKGVAEFSLTRGRLSPQKIITIPNGVDYEHFALATPADLTQFGIPTDGRCLISVGRLDPQKDPLTLLDSFAGIASTISDLHLLYVGDGPLRAELEAQVRTLQLEQRVHFSGRVDDVAALLKAADCFALASRWEGMPNAVLEAMAAGLPVVVTDVEGIGEIIEMGKTGVLVERQSASALGSAIQLVMSDTSAGSSMGVAAQVISQKEHTWKSVTEKYDGLYGDLVGQGDRK